MGALAELAWRTMKVNILTESLNNILLVIKGHSFQELLSRQVSGELFRKKFPVRPSKTIAFALSALVSGVVTQGGLFGTRPPGSPAKTSTFLSLIIIMAMSPESY